MRSNKDLPFMLRLLDKIVPRTPEQRIRRPDIPNRISPRGSLMRRTRL